MLRAAASKVLRKKISRTSHLSRKVNKLNEMPQEHKPRGRRDAHREEKKELNKQKRKRENPEREEPRHKKSKLYNPAKDLEITGKDNADEPAEEGEGAGDTERPFYGMLEDEEQEYFRRADELLEVNDFPSEEERSLFLANVYQEADGKELKIACSQSCSRLMERLILLSTVEQKKKLFENFAGNFAHLVQHRFASHCCETLFIQSAPVVTEELTADSKKKEPEKDADMESDVSMEFLFLQALDELEGKVTFLLSDRFASHTLRVLLVILSGRPLEQSSTYSLLRSKRKEKISITGLDTSATELSLSKRSVPSSFQFAVEKIISDTIATMDTSFIRILATHPVGNPTLQLLLEIELTNPNNKKGTNATEKTIISALLPDDMITEGSESAVFINGILYDAIGSRLLETICTFAPGKLFKTIYRTTFKPRIAALARNEISSYPTIRVLARLSKEDLEEAIEQIIPQIEDLVKRNRTVVIKTLFERCHARGADIAALTAALNGAYGLDPESLVLKMACIDDVAFLIASTTFSTSSTTETEANKKPPPKLTPTPAQTHGSVLAQTLLSIPGAPASLVQYSLLALPHETLLALALYTTTTHILQSALAPTPSNTVPFRRKLINALLFPTSPTSADTDSPILTLSLNPSGSHILDALLTSTTTSATSTGSSPLFQLTERIALSLIANEFTIRESFTGRIVWRNWSLDLFKRERGKWVNKLKSAAPLASSIAYPTANKDVDDEDSKHTPAHPRKRNRPDKKERDVMAVATSNAPASSQKPAAGGGKSAIQLAREKFAATKVLKAQGGGKGRGTGANAGVVG